MAEEWITDAAAVQLIREITQPPYSVGAAQAALDEALGSRMVRCRRTAGVLNWSGWAHGWKLGEDRLRWVDNIGQEVKISHREINKDDLAFFCSQRLAVVAQTQSPSAIVANALEAKADGDSSAPLIGRHPSGEPTESPRWKKPATEPPRSQVAAWATWKVMTSNKDWADGIPRRLKDGKLRSLQKLTDEINNLLGDPKATPFINKDVRERLRGGVSATTVKRALGLKQSGN
jgi:hypothetical protein